MEKEEILKEVLKYIDVKGLAIELVLKKIVYEALDKAVADSANSLDDALAGMLKPVISDFAQAELEKYLEKLAGPKAE